MKFYSSNLPKFGNQKNFSTAPFAWCKNTFSKTLATLVFNKNFLIFNKLLTKIKKKSSLNFFKKLRYLRSRVISTRRLNYERRKTKFDNFENSKRDKHLYKIAELRVLVRLAQDVNSLGTRVVGLFSTKFVGKDAYLLLDQLLSKYLSMYKSWYENEKWGFFDMDLPEKTKLKLMKFFWLSSPRKSSYLPLWKKATEDVKQDYRSVRRFGYTMRNFKISDQLFFWHAFTRKRLQHNLWLFQGKKFFKTLAAYRVKKYSHVNTLNSVKKKNLQAFSFLTIYQKRWFISSVVKIVDVIYPYNTKQQQAQFFKKAEVAYFCFLKDLSIINFFFSFFFFYKLGFYFLAKKDPSLFSVLKLKLFKFFCYFFNFILKLGVSSSQNFAVIFKALLYSPSFHMNLVRLKKINLNFKNDTLF